MSANGRPDNGGEPGLGGLCRRQLHVARLIDPDAVRPLSMCTTSPYISNPRAATWAGLPLTVTSVSGALARSTSICSPVDQQRHFAGHAPFAIRQNGHGRRS